LQSGFSGFFVVLPQKLRYKKQETPNSRHRRLLFKKRLWAHFCVQSTQKPGFSGVPSRGERDRTQWALRSKYPGPYNPGCMGEQQFCMPLQTHV
jgi:hypothetical protein